MKSKKYAVLDEAIERLRLWEKTCEQDNGLRRLISGGSMDAITEWYRQVEMARTPQQRAAELTQKLARAEYDKFKPAAVNLIKSVQSRRYPVFAIPDYENTWVTFKAPSMALAKKFLLVLRDSTKWQPEVIRADKIKPVFEKMPI